MKQSTSTRPRHTWTAAIVEPTPVETCPFCAVRIRHAQHVPCGSVRVGQDFGDAG